MGEASAHHKLAHIGEQLLLPALQKGNKDKSISIGAFYLGNWLADVSQTVDPVAYARAEEGIGDIEKRLTTWLDAGSVMAYLTPSTAIETVKIIMTAVKSILKKGKNGKLANGFKSMMFFLGYEKFVYSATIPAHNQMDEKLYFKIFEERFTQYFPHEHLDRPEVGKGHYDTRKDASTSRGIYTYLEEHIKVAAGALSYLDAGKSIYHHKSWAAASFSQYRTQFIGRDGKMHAINSAEWNYSLAMLGHALHAVEDYFAHSFFVDLAYFVHDKSNTLNEEDEATVALRLKEWTCVEKDTPRYDTHIATGYYDTFDTLNSLLHLYEGLLERVETAKKDGLVSILNYALEHPEKVASMLKSPPLSLLPKPVKEAFESAVQIMTEDGVISAYLSLKNLSDFFSAPLEWMREYVDDQIVSYVEDTLKEKLYTQLGARRIGCHSLIAKDGKHACLYEQAMNCAAAVHWYVVHTLTRHGSRSADISRSGSQTTSRNRVMASAIDWHELLGHFLRHPLRRAERDALGVRNVGVTITHYTRWKDGSSMSSDRLDLLAQEYAPTYEAPPDGPKTLTWEMIADANFGTKGMSPPERAAVINQFLAIHSAGVPVTGGNLAFKPDIPILIPHQKAPVPVMKSTSTTKHWWQETFALKGQPTSVAAHAYIAKYHTLKPVALDYAPAFYAEALALQNKLRAAYGNGEALDWIF